MKKRASLLFKFGIIFLIFSVVTLTVSGFATYLNQKRIYQAQQVQKQQDIADYLTTVIQANGDDFPMYQAYFLEHWAEMDIPCDFTDADVIADGKAFASMFAQACPGRTLGVDIQLDELSPEIQMAFGVYNHEYYLSLFEKARDIFGLSYLYYIVPTGEPLHMYYVLDVVRENRGDGNINLGLDIYEPMDQHAHMWEAWETGRAPSDFDNTVNQFGNNYAWYTPLYLNGTMLGLIGTDVWVEDYNHAIGSNTLRQLGSIALILLVAQTLTLVFIDRFYISRVRNLSHAVTVYAQDKDVGIARQMEHAGHDELSHLGNQTAAMILELDNYMNTLVTTTEALTHAREQNERAKRLQEMTEGIVWTLAHVIDAKDEYTNGHSIRVSKYAVALGKKLGWSDENIAELRWEAMLHDIGKVGIPDAVLNKPGRLTDEEFDIIKSHTTIGGDILDESEELHSASQTARYHHERFDGRGYPQGLAGEDIPIRARVVAIADAYDAMHSDRIYRKGLSHEAIRAELIRGRGTQWDPCFLDVFFQLFESGALDECEAN